ncbi:hypothetical protein INT45_012491 [Circinella minor]|uniref:Uncharacterized protein n=1 Tax=Circinella minor TaxID=1195481 RepID=A0A8H7RUD8_9FUNG|nr:hypothetical protein INT45_012491 [Circinella minor]
MQKSSTTNDNDYSEQIQKRIKKSTNTENGPLSRAELVTPEHPEGSPKGKPEAGDPNWIKKVKGSFEEFMGVLTQDGDLQGRGEQLKIDGGDKYNANYVHKK